MRRRRVVGAAAGIAVLAGLLLLVRGAGPQVLPLPVEAGPAVPADPLPTAAVDAATRSSLAVNLLAGRDAGLGDWLDRRFGVVGLPGDRFVETHGSGDAAVTVPGSPVDGGGRLTVLLVLAEDGAAGWSTAHLVVHDDRTIHLEPTSERSGALRAGVPAIGRLDFSGRSRPTRLLVTAPGDARWGVAVLTSG
ncbi:hypothetical protein [uncultured Amnibacterium sp.]|uniref:hypothetical protein n=1 Tax=uncultured Amnibacterium sp. TaxID=1631851 RepID=UPI0035CA202E